MAYVRTKRIKTKKGNVFEYGYLVRSRYNKRERGARQKIICYLGRVFRFPKIKEDSWNLSPEETRGCLKKRRFQEVIIELIKNELICHGFGENNEVMSNGRVWVSFPAGLWGREGGGGIRVRDSEDGEGRDVVIQMNEGFLCKETCQEIMNFKGEGDYREIGERLGNILLGAGLKIPKELFVAIFEEYMGIEE